MNVQSKQTIQALVLQFAWKFRSRESFHIQELRLWAATKLGFLLSYKQVRNALYRLRAAGYNLCHIWRGSYRWGGV